MCGLRDVAVNSNAVAFVAVSQVVGKLDGSVDLVARPINRLLVTRHLVIHVDFLHILCDAGDHNQFTGPDASGASDIGTLTRNDDPAARFQAIVHAVKFDEVTLDGLGLVDRVNRLLGQVQRFGLGVNSGATEHGERCVIL